MMEPTKSKKPAAAAKATPPETYAQTKPVEDKLLPEHNGSESYGKSSEHASRSTPT